MLDGPDILTLPIWCGQVPPRNRCRLKDKTRCLKAVFTMNWTQDAIYIYISMNHLSETIYELNEPKYAVQSSHDDIFLISSCSRQLFAPT
jgi:hypothetical protein